MVQAVLADVATAPVPPGWRELLGFVEKIATASAAIRKEDVDAVMAAGWSAEAVYDAITVVALFAFYNAWVDASGVHDMPAAAYDEAARRMVGRGYVITPPET